MADSPLVSTAWLAEHINDADLRLVDSTVHLRPTTPGPNTVAPYTVDSGRADYDAGHIFGAAFIDLANDFSDPSSDLRFTMPGAAPMAAALGRVGIGNQHRVVVYSSSTPMWATRFWWMLRASGHSRVHVLDGGLHKWRAEGRAISAVPHSYRPTQYTAAPQASCWADKEAVLAAIGSGDVCTINALSPSVHAGTAEMSYGRKGHIAGSINVPYAALTNPDGTFRSAAELRELFAATGALRKQRIICYCGGGISATMDALALTLLDFANVAVYDGSMSEWVRDPTLPMTLGS